MCLLSYICASHVVPFFLVSFSSYSLLSLSFSLFIRSNNVKEAGIKMVERRRCLRILPPHQFPQKLTKKRRAGKAKRNESNIRGAFGKCITRLLLVSRKQRLIKKTSAPTHTLSLHPTLKKLETYRYTVLRDAYK